MREEAGGHGLVGLSRELVAVIVGEALRFDRREIVHVDWTISRVTTYVRLDMVGSQRLNGYGWTNWNCLLKIQSTPRGNSDAPSSGRVAMMPGGNAGKNAMVARV